MGDSPFISRRLRCTRTILHSLAAGLFGGPLAPLADHLRGPRTVSRWCVCSVCLIRFNTDPAVFAVCTPLWTAAEGCVAHRREKIYRGSNAAHCLLVAGLCVVIRWNINPSTMIFRCLFVCSLWRTQLAVATYLALGAFDFLVHRLAVVFVRLLSAFVPT